MLKDKFLSILGDSVSTYKDASCDASANKSAEYNPYFYKMPFPLEKTYWWRILEAFEMKLCVNNSWSGGNLSGQDMENSGVNRAGELATDKGQVPDLIIVFMGLNDLGRGVSPDVFKADYEKTLATIKKKYPLATVCCVNLPDRDPCFKPRVNIFNDIICEATKNAGDNFFVADLYNSPLNNDFYYTNTVDGLHPDEDGMRYIAEVVENAIRKYYGDK